jgi:2-iminobutanoate/2-iminopropanoate deaminase
MADIGDETARHPLVTRPRGARQHVTAGPYSPVLEIDAARLVVISGQVAVDMDGNVVGATIEEQTRATLDNCAGQLASAGCTLGDVFKVNIYLADLGHWTRFNAVYEEVMREPLPVRTAVQAVLLPGFLVEIEMWAVKASD